MTSRFLFLIFLFVLVSLIYPSFPQAEAVYCQDDNNVHCYARADRSFIGLSGISSTIETSDLYVNQYWDVAVTDPDTILSPTSDCRKNIAVTSAWLNLEFDKWLEVGITAGGFTGLDGSSTCTANQFAYYAIGDLQQPEDSIIGYTEIAVPSGRLDPGEESHIEISKNLATGNYDAYFGNAGDFAKASIDQGGVLVEFAQIGIEGTTHAPYTNIDSLDTYSSIPNTVFSDLSELNGNTWSSWSTPSPVLSDQDHGYIAKNCGVGSAKFVAGSVSALDCNNIAVSNQRPSVTEYVEVIVSDVDVTVSLDSDDFDNDYLQFQITKIPDFGIIDFPFTTKRLPNTDADSAQIIYSPPNTPQLFDIVTYTVSDGRPGHTRTVTLNFTSSDFTPIPDAINDLSATSQINPSSVTLSWSSPNDNGVSITGYKIEYIPNGLSSWQVIQNSFGSSLTTSYTHTNVSEGETYSYRVPQLLLTLLPLFLMW